MREGLTDVIGIQDIHELWLHITLCFPSAVESDWSSAHEH